MRRWSSKVNKTVEPEPALLCENKNKNVRLSSQGHNFIMIGCDLNWAESRAESESQLSPALYRLTYSETVT